jgi:precorrin-6B methylase 1
MKGDQVVQYLKGSSPEEVAEVLLALGTNVKKRAEILTALRTADAERATEIERLLARRNPTGP